MTTHARTLVYLHAQDAAINARLGISSYIKFGGMLYYVYPVPGGGWDAVPVYAKRRSPWRRLSLALARFADRTAAAWGSPSWRPW